MGEPHEPADGELVRRALAGDTGAFGALIERYERVIGSLCRQKVGRATDAEDVVQEAFLKAFAKLDTLGDPDRFGPWVYGIAFRAAVDHHRRRGRSGRIVSLEMFRDEGGHDPPDGHESAPEAALRREEAERVLEAVGALPDRYRLVLTLRYQGHMSYREIAEHLGEPDGTVANRLHRAVHMLRERLGVPAGGR